MKKYNEVKKENNQLVVILIPIIEPGRGEGWFGVCFIQFFAWLFVVLSSKLVLIDTMRRVFSRRFGGAVWPALLALCYGTLTSRVSTDQNQNNRQPHRLGQSQNLTFLSQSPVQDSQQNREEEEDSLGQADKSEEKNPAKEKGESILQKEKAEERVEEEVAGHQGQQIEKEREQAEPKEGKSDGHPKSQIPQKQGQQPRTTKQQQAKETEQPRMSAYDHITPQLSPNQAYLSIGIGAQGTDDSLAKIKEMLIHYFEKISIKIKSDDTVEVGTAPREPGHTLVIKNGKNHAKSFTIGECLQNEENLQDFMFSIASFLNPPQTLSSGQKFREYLSMLQDDEYLVMAYLPTRQEYLRQVQPTSDLDTFSSSKEVPIDAIRQAFYDERYSSGSRKNLFLVVENSELARELKLNTSTQKIGEKVVFTKATRDKGMEVSMQVQGIKYTVRKIPLIQDLGRKTDMDLNKNKKNTDMKMGSKPLGKADLYTHPYVNQINYERDMRELVRKMEWAEDNRKIFLVSCREKKKELKEKVHSTLVKVGKVLHKEVVVVLTENEKILTNCFQVEPDPFVTVRLLDIDRQNCQMPLMVFPDFTTFSKSFYSRWALEGPFSVENICRFVRNSHKLPQHYERKQNLQTISTTLSNKGYQQGLTAESVTVTLHEKHGCKGCIMANSYLELIHQIIGHQNQNQKENQKENEEKEMDEDQGKRGGARREKQSIEGYEVDDMGILRRALLQKYNILNEYEHLEGHEPVNQKQHDLTPKLILGDARGGQIDLEIGKVMSKAWGEFKGSKKEEEEMHKEIIEEIIGRITSGIRTLDHQLY